MFKDNLKTLRKKKGITQEELAASQLLDSQMDTEEQPDAIAEQLSRIAEQLAVRNQRTKKIWKTVAIIVGVIVAAYMLLIVLGGVLFAPYKTFTTTEDSQSVEEWIDEEQCLDISD